MSDEPLLPRWHIEPDRVPGHLLIVFDEPVLQEYADFVFAQIREQIQRMREQMDENIKQIRACNFAEYLSLTEKELEQQREMIARMAPAPWLLRSIST